MVVRILSEPVMTADTKTGAIVLVETDPWIGPGEIVAILDSDMRAIELLTASLAGVVGLLPDV